MDGARIYAENAIRKRTEQMNYLRLASRLDAVVARLDTQAKMTSINKSMASIVKSLESTLATAHRRPDLRVQGSFQITKSKQTQLADLHLLFPISTSPASSFSDPTDPSPPQRRSASSGARYGKREVKLKAEKGNNVKPKEEAKVVEEKRVESVKEESKESKDLGQQAKTQSVLEVMKGVEVLFDEAAESGNEVLKIFDAGKFRYYYKNSLYQGVSTKKLHTVAPSLLERNGSIHGGLDEDLGIISVNLSSTLRKLCLWEKKLYHEVKAEEKLRLILAKNCGQMNILGEKVTDDSQVNSTQPLLRMLSTKITVSIQVIDNISINYQ